MGKMDKTSLSRVSLLLVRLLALQSTVPTDLVLTLSSILLCSVEELPRLLLSSSLLVRPNPSCPPTPVNSQLPTSTDLDSPRDLPPLPRSEWTCKRLCRSTPLSSEDRTSWKRVARSFTRHLS